jgi:hypothetical protein
MVTVTFRYALLSSVIALACACGGKPAKNPDNAMQPSDDPPKDDTSSTPPGDDTSTKSSPPPASDEPTIVACEVKVNASLVSCAEAKLSGDEIAKSKERCTSASGEPREGACGRDKVIGTCDAPDKNVTVYTYAAPNASQTKGRLSGAKGGCDQLGGTFTKAAGGGGKQPKRAGKPPKKK